MTSFRDKSVGRLVRIIYNDDDDTVQLVMEITDPDFKHRVLHNGELRDILSLSGKDVVLVDSDKKQ